jgi:hypothetical protein
MTASEGYPRLAALARGPLTALSTAGEPNPSVEVSPPDLPDAIESEPRSVEEEKVDLASSLPPGCALLVVETANHGQGGARRFQLKFILGGQTEESSEEDIEKQEVPDFSLRQIAERAEWEDDFYALRTWWGNLHQVGTWSAKLLGCGDSARPNQTTRLVLWDTTDHQIPWELCYVDNPTSGGPSGWLGSLIEVIRWTTIHSPGRQKRYTGVQATTAGRVLLLETDDIVNDSGGSGVEPLARRFDARVERTMRGLVDQLGPGQPGAALVMIHTHGVDDRNGQVFGLAEMTMNKLNAFDMPALGSPGAVVLLNACNTARLVPVSPASYRATRSFAELFLRKGAASVIATLGPVGLDHTYAFTDKLLNSNQRRVSALLLEHRRRYARKVADPGTTHHAADFENFFSGFMHVCFGHPDTVLALPTAVDAL